MPLYEVSPDGLVPFRQLRGADVFESEIERLLWDNLDDLTGEFLLPIRRQARIFGGGRPDIVALDRAGSVVVIEVKRDVDRSQLAQLLEYAGWARTTNLDEIAGLYFAGAPQFWSDWQEFTETTEPVRISRTPRLILAARDFDGRTNAAIGFLLESQLPIKVITVGLYEDARGRRFLDLEGVDEPLDTTRDAPSGPQPPARRRRSRVTLADLVNAELLRAGDRLTWPRPRLNQTYNCTVTEDGRLQLSDGRRFASPSGAAMAAAKVPACDGWYAWRPDAQSSITIADLREQFEALDASAGQQDANQATSDRGIS